MIGYFDESQYQPIEREACFHVPYKDSDWLHFQPIIFSEKYNQSESRTLLITRCCIIMSGSSSTEGDIRTSQMT